MFSQGITNPKQSKVILLITAEEEVGKHRTEEAEGLGMFRHLITLSGGDLQSHTQESDGTDTCCL